MGRVPGRSSFISLVTAGKARLFSFAVKGASRLRATLWPARWRGNCTRAAVGVRVSAGDQPHATDDRGAVAGLLRLEVLRARVGHGLRQGPLRRTGAARPSAGA